MLEESTEIYSPHWGQHLGDGILTLNYLAHESYELNRRVRVADHFLKFIKFDVGTNPQPGPNNTFIRKSCTNLYEIEKLVLEKDRFIVINEDPTFLISDYDWSNIYRHRFKPFLTNKYQFSKMNIDSNLVAYQFNAKRRDRIFPSLELEEFTLKAISDMGFTLVPVGYGQTLEECSEIISKAEFLVSVMSGMAWIAATTRTPVFVVGYGRSPRDCIIQIGGYQTFLHARDYLTAIENIKNYKDDRVFYDKNCFSPERVRPMFTNVTDGWLTRESKDILARK